MLPSPPRSLLALLLALAMLDCGCSRVDDDTRPGPAPPVAMASRAGKARHPSQIPGHSTNKLSSGELTDEERERAFNLSQSAKNVTFLLDNLLKDYDNSLRPDMNGKPLLVEINMQVRSMGPISEIDMSYSMDCYFRQSWVDKRLAFSGQKNLALSIEMLRKIWKPDTYIYNGRKSYLHTITTPNKFMRLFPNGRVLYSQRLTIKAGCQMDLADFPMDKQRCPLQIGSFGYTNREVFYQWTSGRGVNIASDMKLSQFDLISTPTGNGTIAINRGDHSTLLVSFHLQRHMGNFVIQVYGPCVLLVVISWVSFWLNREATSDRITLGVTTVLTMTFLGLEARTDLPQVSYPTALDFFVFISFMSIFTTVVQFALVHFFTKVGGGEYYLEELEETVCLHELKRKIMTEKKLLKRLEEEKEEEEERQRLLRQDPFGPPPAAHDISLVGNHVGVGAGIAGLVTSASAYLANAETLKMKQQQQQTKKDGGPPPSTRATRDLNKSICKCGGGFSQDYQIREGDRYEEDDEYFDHYPDDGCHVPIAGNHHHSGIGVRHAHFGPSPVPCGHASVPDFRETNVDSGEEVLLASISSASPPSYSSQTLPTRSSHHHHHQQENHLQPFQHHPQCRFHHHSTLTAFSPLEDKKERNVLNHHPYGTFFYSKKNGRCGRRMPTLPQSAVASSRSKHKNGGSPPGTIKQLKEQLAFRHQQLSQLRNRGGNPQLRLTPPTSQEEQLLEITVPPPPPPRREDSQRSMEELSIMQISGNGVDVADASAASLSLGNGGVGVGPMEECGCKRCITRAMDNPEKALNSVSKIDKISRVVFPLTFALINMFYWYSYLKHSERIDLSFEDP